MRLSSVVVMAGASVAFMAGSAVAWGKTGHQAVAMVAEKFMTSQALKVANDYLGTADISSIASWADQVKRSKKYSFTGPLHYVDTEDDPADGSCSLQRGRDCSDNKCILSAIENYTDILSCSSTASHEDKVDALKFVVHFVGDIVQPLHASGRNKGGNGDKVKSFFGKSGSHGRPLNLHFIYDTNIVERNMGQQTVAEYADGLAKRVESGDLADQAKSWIDCSGNGNNDGNSTTTPSASAKSSLICPDVWAADTNKLNCKIVYPKYSPDVDLGEDYYQGVADPINIQIAKGGYRLAAVLNDLLTCDASSSGGVSSHASFASNAPFRQHVLFTAARPRRPLRR